MTTPRTLRVRSSLSLASVLCLVGVGAAAQNSIPSRLSDQDLWRLSADLSEPGGYFRSENLLSNETGYQAVIPALRERIKPGGVYLGVGPEQNFTYIVALQPKIAFIVDIRRGNLIEQLMYKALIETSADRADFLAKLFSRARPAGLDTTSTAEQLFAAYEAAAPDSSLYRRNLAAIRTFLSGSHGFVWSDSDAASLEHIYYAFFDAGPQINYSYPYGGGGFGRGMPTYTALQTTTDTAGKNWGFLASESNFRWLKEFESRNLLVPVVGDFGGPKAVRAVGQYVADHHAAVSAFYTSNVEQYLFQSDSAWIRYYRSVATLPLETTSMFIRSVGGGFRSIVSTGAAPTTRYGNRLASVTCSIQDLLKAFDEGRIRFYGDVIAMSR
jgi:hypothetical protein